MLLLPTGYYLTGGALAVASSFVALVLIPPGALKRVAAMHLPLVKSPPERLRLATSFAGFIVLLTLIAAGFIGSRDPLSNPLPLTVWTLMWIGLTLIQGLGGDLWRWINPWHAPARLVAFAAGRERFLELPEKAGWWPAVVLFFAFAWFELIYPAPDDPWRLASAAGLYLALNLALAIVFGAGTWLRRGECLSAFFSMVSRFAVIEGHDAEGRRRFALRWPGARLGEIAALPLSGTVFLLLVLGSVSFDGLSRTFFWLGANGVNPLEFPGRTAMMATNTLGLLAVPVALAAIFFATVWLGERLAGSRRLLAPAGLLVWSIVPIALAYHFAHYLTALAVNGQYALVAISDPFSLGWNLFGTADNQVSAGIVVGSGPAWLLWNLQAGAIIGGHILAVVVAHLLAGRLHDSERKAALSQLPLTALMVGYTVFGLWLLSTPTVA